MLVSIVIIVRDEDPQVLEATLAGLHATTRHIPTEVIIVDDGSLLPVRSERWPARLLRHPQPLGACEARRVGAAMAVGHVIVWLDAHMSFGSHWLESMLVHADADVLLCSPFCTYDRLDCMCWGADFVWNDSRDYSANLCPGLGFRHRTAAPDGTLTPVPMVIGACYAMRRASYMRMGGFSPHFLVWGSEEQDISARTWMAGMSVACVPAARVGHLSRASFPYPVQFHHVEFNQILLLRCLLEQATLQRLEPCFQPLPAVVAGWLDRTEYRPWRSEVQRRRRMSDAEFFRRFVPALTAISQPAETLRSA